MVKSNKNLGQGGNRVVNIYKNVVRELRMYLNEVFTQFLNKMKISMKMRLRMNHFIPFNHLQQSII